MFDNCDGDHSKGGYGLNAQGGQDWANDNKKALGQSSLFNFNAEFNQLGALKLDTILDTKFFGGQFQGTRRYTNQPDSDSNYCIHVSNAWVVTSSLQL